MSGDGKPQLRVIRGGGEHSQSTRPALLVAVERPPAEPQLVLPSMPRNRPALISVGFDGITFPEFAELLRTTKVHRVVDIRMLAAFRSRGFQRWQLDELFGELGISYERILALGNQFLGTSTNPVIVLQRYTDYIRQERTLIRALGARFEEGSFVLLGRSSDHEGSEREVVAQALADVGFSFDLVIATPPGTMQVMELVPRKRHSKPKSTRPSSSAQPSQSNQEHLPFREV